MKSSKSLLIKRIRKPDNNFYNYLRLNRAEFGHSFKSKKKIIDNLKYYPSIDNLIKKLSKSLDVKNENMLIGLGAESIIKDILYSYGQEKKNLGFLTPNYMMYKIYGKLYQYKSFNLNIDPETPIKLDFKTLKKFLKEKKIDIFILVNPSHPFEKNWSISELVKLLKFCKQNQILLIIDEVYQGLGSVSAIKLIKRFTNLIIIQSFSKNFGLPGIRVGYALSIKKNIEKIESCRLSIELPFYSIKIASQYLDNKKKTLAIKKQIINARTFAHQQFKKRHILSFGEHGNSVTFKVRNNIEAKKIGNFLFKKKILINYRYKKPFDNFLNITTTNKKNLKFFFLKFDLIKNIN